VAVYYLNDKWVSEDDMRLSAFDTSVLRGFGVFDFLKVYNRVGFAIADHLDRYVFNYLFPSLIFTLS